MKETYTQLEQQLLETRTALSDTKAALSETKAALSETKAALSETKVVLSETEVVLSETKAMLLEREIELEKTKDSLKQALHRILTLEERLKIDSKNSSKPPSSDQKANTSSKPHKKRRSREGRFRKLYPAERIDSQVTCNWETCAHCGSNSIELLDSPPEIFQQAELPEVKAIVTEYLLRKYRCRFCGKKSIAKPPKGILYSAFGPKITSLFAYLTGTMHLSKREAIQLIKDICDVDIGLGSAPNIEERVANALDPVYQRIHHAIIEGKFCKHFDETGWRNSGKKHYVWLASCTTATFFAIHPHRNQEAFEMLLKGKKPTELTAVTDRYATYKSIGKLQYCLAHLIRDFRLYSQREGPDHEIGTALEQELRKVCKIHGKYREGKIPLKKRNLCLGHCKRRVKNWLEDGIANGSDQLFGLCERLLDDFHRLWTFTKIEDMEPTNNLAERDLRKLVIWRKKSYGTRSSRGKRFVERITSITETLKRNGKNVLHFIHEAMISASRGEEVPYICNTLGF